ncbi:MAG: fasciclin domain-containing protein, partial [Verrucomicrobiales bacterium]
PAETIEALLGDKALLRKVLLNHLLYGSKTSEDLAGGSARTLARQTVDTVVDDGILTQVNDSEVLQADVEASNGTVHVIDTVLMLEMPQSLTALIAARDELGTLEAALGITGQADVFDSTVKYPAYTIFAPRNAAFEEIPSDILNGLLEDPEALADVLGFHVVKGTVLAENLRNGQRFGALNGGYLNIKIDDEGTVMVNNATVVTPNLRAANGVVHIIDAVLAEEPFSVADLIRSKPYLSTLAAALEATELDDAVDGDGEFTVFAPLDSAFAALPEGTVEGLLNDLPALSNILLLHVAPGSQTKADLAESGGTTSLQGGELELEIKKKRVWWWSYNIITINGARIISTDLKADNGIVHLIAGVLLPEAAEEESD